MASVSLGTGMVLNPTSVKLATQDNYVSALTTAALAMHKRDVDENFVKRYGNQGITGLLELVGAKKEATQSTFQHYEEAFIHNTVKVTFGSANPSGAGSLNLTFIAEDSVDQESSPAAASISGTNEDMPVRVGDLLMTSQGDILYVHTLTQHASAPTIAVYNTQGTTWSGSGYDTSSGEYVTIIGNTFAENTDQPSSMLPRIHTYENNVMIIKESFEVSGTEATNVIYFKVDNEKMGSGYLWYLKGEADTYKRFLDYCELQLIMGKTVDSSQTNMTQKGTEGLLDFIESRGQSMDLGSSSITMADFDAVVKSLDKYRGAKEMALYAGIDLSLDIDDLLAAQGAYAAGGANYGTFNNNKNMALNLGFNSFSRGGYTFHKKTYDLFNHPKLMGASGFNYPGYGMCIPMDTQRDAKSGAKIPSLRIRYKAANGYSREMEHWLTGSAVLKNKTNSEDNLKSHYRTERGFEGFAPNRFMLIKKS